jgi:hypothetical protein
MPSLEYRSYFGSNGSTLAVPLCLRLPCETSWMIVSYLDKKTGRYVL